MGDIAGIFDIPEAEYHADKHVPGGSLSSTMLKHILRAPAYLRHYLDAPREEKDAYDVGHLVHAGVLGVGMQPVEIPADLLASNGAASTKAAKAFVEEARAAGLVPVKAEAMETITAAVESVKRHPVAGQLFTGGHAEQSIFAQDPDTGVWLRGRIDYLLPDGTLVDLKTTRSGEPIDFERQGRGLGYPAQLAHYSHICGLIGIPVRRFLHVTVEVKAPYLVDVHQMIDWPEIGESQRAHGTALYAECLAADIWPGRTAEIHQTASPDWALPEEEIE